MARREHGGLSYETAEGWQSRDVVVLTRAGSDGEVHNIVMAWETREPSEQLFQHAFRQSLRSAQKCAGGFQTKEFSKTLVAGRAAVRTRYLRRGEGGVPLEQVVYWIDCPNAEVLSIACTSLCSVDRTLPVLNDLLGSLDFGARPGQEPAPLPPRNDPPAYAAFPGLVPTPLAVR